MEQPKTDLRSIRSKMMITDAFLELSRKNPFKDISVKDITEAAMINRATFYNHFLDKYDLLEKVIADKLALDLNCESQNTQGSVEETIRQVFLSLTSFQTSLEHYWTSQDEAELIQTIVESELTRIFKDLVVEQNLTADLSLIQKVAKLLTASLIGMSRDWVQSSTDESPEAYIASMLPFILGGLKK